MKSILCQRSIKQLFVLLVLVTLYIGASGEYIAHRYSSPRFYPLRAEQKQMDVRFERSDPSLVLPQQPANCEDALLYLDEAVVKTRSMSDTYLIIIARLGDGEDSTRLNKSRLSIIERSYLRRFPDIKYVTGIGSRVRGLGRIEIYVGGKLLHTLLIEKNAKSFCPEPI